MLYSLGDKKPVKADSCFVAHNATIVGDVELAEDVSIWFNVVIRAEMEKVTIGKGTNIQDGSVLHVDEGFPLTFGEGVTVGHKAMVHGCTVGDYSLIGINAVVLDGAKIGKHCLVGANALVPSGMEVPDGSMVLGSPAKIKRQLSEQEIEHLHKSAQHYIENGQRFKTEMKLLR